MAAPIVAGAADIVIQALGGYANWNWTRSQALLPKTILLMTATETYPNLRESFSSTYSPTLERGGKDVHEGYGRLNLDAAVDAILKTYQVGTTVNNSLGKPPTLTDISVLGQRLAWARNVQLVSGFKYNFTLSIPVGADYDLYLYNNTGTTYGEPAIVTKSATATTGGTETFNVTAPYNGTYYIVVKRATETTGSGSFTLTSSGPVNVTLSTPRLSSASNAVHYTKNGASRTGSISANAFSDYADTGTTLTIDNPINVSTTQRYGTINPTSFLVQTNGTFTVNYTLQYRVTINQTGVSSDFTGTVVIMDGVNYSVTALPAAFWWNQSSAHNFAFASPLAVNSSKQYVWNSTSGLSILQSGTLMITDPGGVVANYNATSHYEAPDIAVISVVSSKTVLGRGYSMPITVTVTNQGVSAETFNVTAYANATSIASQTVTLAGGNLTTLTFTWNAYWSADNATDFDYGNYTISAYVLPVPGETDTADNNLTTPNMILVGMPGDVMSPYGVIDMKDISYVAKRFNTDPSKPLWDPNADVNGDDRIDMKDISTVARHFGEHYP